MGETTWDWAKDRAERWAAVADRLEAQIAPVDDVLFAAAALAPGERVLEVGPGRGVTTRRAAEEVGPEGRIVALDIADQLADEARRRTPDDAPVDFVVGDAQVHPVEGLAVDAVISRFGVMFFADPVAAFANLGRAVVPGGRLCVAVWQPRDRSPVMERPIEVATRVAEARGVTLALPAPDVGPFSLGDPDVATGVLEAAGWHDVDLAPHRLPMYAAGPSTAAEVADTVLTLGALQDALTGAPAELVDEVRQAIEADLAPLHDGTGIVLEGAIAILTARRAA